MRGLRMHFWGLHLPDSKVEKIGLNSL
jgi:hypothetical protein